MKQFLKSATASYSEINFAAPVVLVKMIVAKAFSHNCTIVFLCGKMCERLIFSD